MSLRAQPQALASLAMAGRAWPTPVLFQLPKVLEAAAWPGLVRTIYLSHLETQFLDNILSK